MKIEYQGEFLEIGYFEQEMDQHISTTCIEEIWNEFPSNGSILMVCHEPEFYEGLATDVWDVSQWTTKVL